jgi:hypothetical protein
MQQWGTTATGSQRYRCAPCQITRVRNRPDNSIRYHRSLFLRWSMGKSTLTELASAVGVTRQTLTTWFRPFWSAPPIAVLANNPRTIILDGTSLEWRQIAVLIAHDPAQSRPVAWSVVDRERYSTWFWFLAHLKQQGISPSFIVCDGQRGMLAVIRSIWSATLIQRCVIHVHRQARLWLTKAPQTIAGQELLVLTNNLLTIKTRRQKRRWIREFKRWLRKHNHFIKERSWNPEGTHWWYTHRKLRAVRSLLRNSTPDLFRYVNHPIEVPRTTNHLEGGVNSRIKELIRSHRGMRTPRKIALTKWYLAVRQEKKPTRNFT